MDLLKNFDQFLKILLACLINLKQNHLRTRPATAGFFIAPYTALPQLPNSSQPTRSSAPGPSPSLQCRHAPLTSLHLQYLRGPEPAVTTDDAWPVD